MLCLTLTYENEIHIQTPAGDAVLRLSENQPEKLRKVRLIVEAPREVTIWREENTLPAKNVAPPAGSKPARLTEEPEDGEQGRERGRRHS